MSINRIDFSKVPRCPLCHNMMVRDRDAIRCIDVWACHRDKIAINVTDPFVGKWDRVAKEKIECPHCTKVMRLFFTMTGFVLAKCPKCGTTIRESNPDRLLKLPPGANAGLSTEKAIELDPEFAKENKPIGHS